jgi:predicted kinase
MKDRIVSARQAPTPLMATRTTPSTRWLLALMGAPGSGKSTLGRALGRTLCWPLIDKDDVRDLLGEATPHAGGLAYDIMFNVARRQLLQGLSVICDSPFAYRRCYERAVNIAQETGAALAVLECRCADETTWRQRVEARQERALPQHHTTDWAAVQAFRRRTVADVGFPIAHPHLIVDTLTSVPALCTQVIAWLERQAVR